MNVQDANNMTTILIVDDSKINQKFLSILLKCAHYSILIASDGAEGLKIARENHPDLIISDIMMPNMDGYEFVNYLRSDPELTNTKVIFYTAVFFGSAAKELAKACGVQHFIVQPTHSKDILNIVESVLNDQTTPIMLPPVGERYAKHHQLISNKLYENSKKLLLINEQLERRIADKTQLLVVANQALTVLSFHDQLTGLYNRRFLETRLMTEIERAKRYDKSFSVLLLDIDHYKSINDTLGHEAGDCVLQKISHCIQHNIRSEDIASRYGGDEFIVILLDVNSKQALQYADRLQHAVETLDIYYNQQLLEQVTLSIGVAMYPMHGKEKSELIKSADASLYIAKNSGRNKVILSDNPIPGATLK